MQMRKIDDIIVGSTKTVQHSIKNISRNVTAVLTWQQNCTSQKKQNDTNCAIAMTTVMLLFLFQFRLKFPDFILNKDHPLVQCNNLMGRVKTIWEPCVSSKTLCPTLKGCKWGYLIFHRQRLEPRINIAIATT